MEAAKRNKRNAQGWVTKAVAEIDAFLQALQNVESVPDHEERYNRILTSFNERLSKWDEAQMAFESLIEDADYVTFLNEAADFRGKVVRSRDGLLARYAKFRPPQKDDSTTATTTATTTASTRPHLNLPRIDLPKFRGAVLKFTPFWQQFKACVDEGDYPTVSKFNLLVSCLEEEASGVIEGMPITAENYEAAKEMLEKRYGRKELIVFGHVQELLALGAPTQLLTFRDTLNVHVRSLAAQGITSDKFGVILTPVIVSKLPEDVRLEWSNLGHPAPNTALCCGLGTSSLCTRELADTHDVMLR
jgi:hypothetical protein